MAMRCEHLDAAEALFAQAAVVLLQFETPLAVVDRALDLARRHGCRAVLDAGPAVVAPPELLAKAEVLTPNETETAALLGMEVADLDAAREAARRFRRMGVETALLKLGGRGALLDDGDRQRWFPAFDIAPVDTTAAGDAFTAAVGVALAEGMAWDSAVPFANAAGALACLVPGAQPSLPTRGQVDAFLQDKGRRLRACC
jgi:ribokinase